MPNYTTSYSKIPKKPHYRRSNGNQLPSARRKGKRRPGAQYLHHTQGFGRHGRGRMMPRRNDSRRPYAIIAVACAALLFVASVVWYINRSVPITLNGSESSVRINSTIQQLIDDQELSYRAGDLLAVDDSVLEKRGGEAYSVVLNGEQIDNAELDTTQLTGGEELTIGDGRDVYEEHEVQATAIQPTLTLKGSGPIQYVETWGIPGRTEVWTGAVSGITADRGVVQEVQNCVVRATSVSPADGKYVALTFDEGPSSYTEQILQVLSDAGATATFFMQGDRVDANQAAVASIAASDNELGSNGQNDVDLTTLSGDDLRQQLTQGFDAIDRAADTTCALLRPPYGLFSEQNWTEAMDLVSAVVTWNIDSGDYLLPGADSVIETVMGSVGNGDIILLTDNDSCGEQTLELLPTLLSRLQDEGYQIVSLSELIKTDEELADALDLSRTSMPADAVLPHLSLEIDEGEGESE